MKANTIEAHCPIKTTQIEIHHSSKTHEMKQMKRHEMHLQKSTEMTAFEYFMSRFVTVLVSVLVAGTLQGATMVNFTPSQSGTTAAPITGMSATSNGYLLTGSDATYTLPSNFTGNNQDAFGYINPPTAKDAASYNDAWHFQLSTTDGLRQVSTTTGANNPNFTAFSVPNAFGVGYDSATDTLGTMPLGKDFQNFNLYF